MKESGQLLRAYAECGDEGAFRELVERYTRLVYSTALRQVGDAHAAEDITQSVFTHLARKAGSLSSRVILGGWLYRDAVFTASKYRRSTTRRRIREHEAASMSNNTEPEAGWEEIAPWIEQAMSRLGARERDAIVLRFFERKPFGAVGAALGISEDAARMRVDRALEKLRQFCVRRGVAISATGLAVMLETDVMGALPGEMTASIATNALHGAGANTGFQIMLPQWVASKFLIVILASVVVIALGLVTGFLWRFARPAEQTSAAPSVAAPVSPPIDTRLIQIRGGVRRTTQRPIAMAFHVFPAVTARPGEQVIVTNARSNYRLMIRPAFDQDKIRIDSSLLEDSAPAMRIVFPTVRATNGEQVIAAQGIYSFEFRPTIGGAP